MLTTKKAASLANQRHRPNFIGGRLKMRRAQTDTTIYLERHSRDPFGADQVFNPFGDFGACADTPQRVQASDGVIAVFGLLRGE